MPTNCFRPRVQIGSLLLALLFLLVLLPSAIGQQTSKPSNNTPVIEFTDVMFSALIWNLCRTADINYILDPRTETNYSKLSARWENITAMEGLDRVLQTNGLRRVESPATTVTRITFTNAPTKFVDPAWIGADTNGPRPLIQMSAVTLQEAISELASNAQQRVEFDRQLPMYGGWHRKPFDLSWNVEFRWQKVTTRQALAALCENYDLVLTPNSSNNVIRISPYIP